MKWTPVSDPPDRNPHDDSALVECLVWYVAHRPLLECDRVALYDTVGKKWFHRWDGDLIELPSKAISHYIVIGLHDAPA